MGTPEGIRGEAIGDKDLIENEHAEVWKDASKKFIAIYSLSLKSGSKSDNDAELEGM